MMQLTKSLCPCVWKEVAHWENWKGPGELGCPVEVKGQMRVSESWRR